jgi:4'-phosphopantetheinyl transferase
MDPPPEPQLAQNVVHVWRAHLDGEPVPTRLTAALSVDERTRAARFVFAKDRSHFSAGRGILRDILGRYLRRAPSDIDFAYDDEGKPRLRLESADPPLQFNLSHSHGLAVYAISCNREIGVDVEAIRSDVTGEDIARHYFSAQELAELRSLPKAMRDEGFFLCWTRKEAYIKARGAGLGIPLDCFAVSLTPGMPEELVSADSMRWALRSFRPAPDYVGAVVAEGQDWSLQMWDWK